MIVPPLDETEPTARGLAEMRNSRDHQRLDHILEALNEDSVPPSTTGPVDGFFSPIFDKCGRQSAYTEEQKSLYAVKFAALLDSVSEIDDLPSTIIPSTSDVLDSPSLALPAFEVYDNLHSTLLAEPVELPPIPSEVLPNLAIPAELAIEANIASKFNAHSLQSEAGQASPHDQPVLDRINWTECPISRIEQLVEAIGKLESSSDQELGIEIVDVLKAAGAQEWKKEIDEDTKRAGKFWKASNELVEWAKKVERELGIQRASEFHHEDYPLIGCGLDWEACYPPSHCLNGLRSPCFTSRIWKKTNVLPLWESGLLKLTDAHPCAHDSSGPNQPTPAKNEWGSDPPEHIAHFDELASKINDAILDTVPASLQFISGAHGRDLHTKIYNAIAQADSRDQLTLKMQTFAPYGWKQVTEIVLHIIRRMKPDGTVNKLVYALDWHFSAFGYRSKYGHNDFDVAAAARLDFIHELASELAGVEYPRQGFYTSTLLLDEENATTLLGLLRHRKFSNPYMTWQAMEEEEGIFWVVALQAFINKVSPFFQYSKYFLRTAKPAEDKPVLLGHWAMVLFAHVVQRFTPVPTSIPDGGSSCVISGGGFASSNQCSDALARGRETSTYTSVPTSIPGCPSSCLIAGGGFASSNQRYNGLTKFHLQQALTSVPTAIPGGASSGVIAGGSFASGQQNYEHLAGQREKRILQAVQQATPIEPADHDEMRHWVRTGNHKIKGFKTGVYLANLLGQHGLNQNNVKGQERSIASLLFPTEAAIFQSSLWDSEEAWLMAKALAGTQNPAAQSAFWSGLGNSHKGANTNVDSGTFIFLTTNSAEFKAAHPYRLNGKEQFYPFGDLLPPLRELVQQRCEQDPTYANTAVDHISVPKASTTSSQGVAAQETRHALYTGQKALDLARSFSSASKSSQKIEFNNKKILLRDFLSNFGVQHKLWKTQQAMRDVGGFGPCLQLVMNHVAQGQPCCQ